MFDIDFFITVCKCPQAYGWFYISVNPEENSNVKVKVQGQCKIGIVVRTRYGWLIADILCDGIISQYIT